MVAGRKLHFIQETQDGGEGWAWPLGGAETASQRGGERGLLKQKLRVSVPSFIQQMLRYSAHGQKRGWNCTQGTEM